MAIEWRNKTENSVEYGRPSRPLFGSVDLIQDLSLRLLLMAKELLCGNQPANLSLVIVVLSFPSYSVILLFLLLEKNKGVITKINTF